MLGGLHTPTIFHHRRPSWPLNDCVQQPTMALLDQDTGAPPKQAWRRKLNSSAGILKEFSVAFMEAVKMIVLLQIGLGLRMWVYVRSDRAHGRVPPIDPFNKDLTRPSSCHGVPLGGMGGGSIGRGFRGEFRQSLVTVLGIVALLACQTSATGDAIGPCLKTCEKTGCAGTSCLPRCQFLNSTEEGGALEKLPVYRRWKEWTCGMECRYHCMLSKETEQAGLEQEAIGYRDNWCLARVMAHQQSSKDLYTHLAKASFTQGVDLRLINEPASAAVSAVNLLGNLFGLLTFLKFVHYHLPSRPISRGPYYPFAGLWTIYGILVTVYWLAQCIIRSRNMAFDKHIDATFEVVLAGYALVLAVVRVCDLRTEQGRVIVMAPCLALLVPHLMYINLCTFDYGLNIQVCLLLGTVQYLLWIIWAGVTRHPARFQLWSIALAGPLTLFFRLYDLSYLWEGLDTDVLWILSTVLSTLMWWSFVTRDADYQTKLIMKKRGDTEGILEVDSKKLQ